MNLAKIIKDPVVFIVIILPLNIFVWILNASAGKRIVRIRPEDFSGGIDGR